MMHQRARDPRPRRFDPALPLAFLLPIFAWAPLTYPGYFVFRSGFLPIFNLADRVSHFGDLAWAPVVGRSYSLLGGDGPFPYLLGAAPVALGASATEAVKWVFGLSLIAGSIGAYGWVKRILGSSWAALVAAAVYLFNPISLHLVYSEGAFAGGVLLALMPWALFFADLALSGRWTALLALALVSAAIVWTQVGLALAFLLVALVYVLIRARTQRGRVGAFAIAAGVLLGALGLLPSILRNGAGTPDWPLSQLPALITPWMALLGGWVAARLGEMLPEQERAGAPALFGALIALPLLLVYGDLQPATAAVNIPNAPLAVFGQNEIALLSVKAVGMPGPSASVAVEVEWQALRPVTRDYTVFFHVVTGNDRRVGQQDTMPQGGRLPTSQWQPGDVVRDRYEVTLSADAPASGDYRYWLGWYLGETGERLAEHEGAKTPPADKYVVKP